MRRREVGRKGQIRIGFIEKKCQTDPGDTQNISDSELLN